MLNAIFFRNRFKHILLCFLGGEKEKKEGEKKKLDNMFFSFE